MVWGCVCCRWWCWWCLLLCGLLVSGTTVRMVRGSSRQKRRTTVSDVQRKTAEVRAAVQESIALADKVQARLVALTDENVALRERLAVTNARLRRVAAAVRENGDPTLVAMVEGVPDPWGAVLDEDRGD